MGIVKAKNMNMREKIAHETKEEMLARQAVAAKDHQRTQYHYQPYPSWMNDPIPFFWKGQYHVFHQHSPEGKPYHYKMNWAHIVSNDLVHWQVLPSLEPPPCGPNNDTWDRYIAQDIHGGPDGSLYEMLNKPEHLHLNKKSEDDDNPTPPRPDSYGLWSGSVIEHDGAFYALYTAGSSGGVCLATSEDLINWDREIDNRVIKGWRTLGERDTCVWKENDLWYMMVNTLDIYQSPDLYNWEYVRTLEGRCEEFPDFFPMDDKYILITHLGPDMVKDDDPRGEYTSYGEAPIGISQWQIGRYANLSFKAETTGLIDWGNLYAASTMLDSQGRRILTAWITEGRSIEEQIAAGWSGVMALPRVVNILPDNTLAMDPVPEVKSLRGEHVQYKDVILNDTAGADRKVLKEVCGDCIEILAKFSGNSANEFGIIVQGTDEIRYNCQKQQLNKAPLKLDYGESLTLRIFVDRSVIEVFANHKIVKTIRTYHRLNDSKDVVIFVCGGEVRVDSIDVWQMRSIY